VSLKQEKNEKAKVQGEAISCELVCNEKHNIAGNDVALDESMPVSRPSEAFSHDKWTNSSSE
jgi:hypothetical protein